MSTFPSPAWRICSCTIREGVCAIELENFWRDVGPRRPCGSAERNSTSLADFPATATVCFCFRQGHGQQRISAGSLQEPVAAGDYLDQHGVHGNLGGGHAADRRVPVDARN